MSLTNLRRLHPIQYPEQPPFLRLVLKNHADRLLLRATRRQTPRLC